MDNEEVEELDEIEDIEEIQELDEVVPSASKMIPHSLPGDESEPELWAEYDAYADEEDYNYDICTRVNIVIYEVLQATISRNVIKETGDDGPVMFTDAMRQNMVKKIIAFNFDKMEDSLYMTQGSDFKLYLCGRWLNRHVFYDGKMLPMKKYLQKVFEDEDITYLPQKNGSDIRKSLWYSAAENENSFNLPKKCKIETFRDDFNPLSFRKEMRDNAKRIVKAKIKHFIARLTGRKLH